MAKKDIIRNHIIDTARILFLKNNINDVLISDIAKASGVGEATIYRYFSKKQNLVLEVAIKEWNDISEDFRIINESTGFNQIKSFYYLFLDIYRANKRFYSFIDELDSFILVDNNINKTEYQEALNKVFNKFIEIYQKGVNDKSIKEIDDIKLFYYATTHSLLSLAKKLSRATLIESDLEYDNGEELEVIINLILNKLERNDEK